MSLSSKLFKQSEGLDQDVPINIASIIDCFTVLITYILAAASFVSLGALEASIAGTHPMGAMASSAVVAPQPIALAHLDIQASNQFEMKTSIDGHAEKKPLTFEQIEGEFAAFKEKNPSLKAVTLSSADAIPYENLVKVVALIRKIGIPVVFSGRPDE